MNKSTSINYKGNFANIRADLTTMYKHAGIADENDGKAVRKMGRNVVMVAGRATQTA